MLSPGLHLLECFDGLAQLDAGSIAMVFADLPYGQTANAWDKKLALDRFWPAIRRVTRPTAAIVCTASQPFTSELLMSNRGEFRYAAVWKKNHVSGILNANRAPMRAHEDILLFARRAPPYLVQRFTSSVHRKGHTRHKSQGANYGHFAIWSTSGGGTEPTSGGGTERYATSVLDIPCVPPTDPDRIHSTQKPEALVAFFLRAYTQPGDAILDPCAGSATTLVAAKRLGRIPYGFENDPSMFAKASLRLAKVVAA